jgi:hypothetical protein
MGKGTVNPTLTTLSNVVGLETLNMVSAGGAGTNTITTDSVTAAHVLTGSSHLTITNALATASFDASAFTGNLNVRGQAAASTNIKGGSGNDTVRGGTAADTIDGGGGNDTIQLGTQASNNVSGADTDFQLKSAGGTVTTTTGLARGGTPQGLAATDAFVVQELAQDAAPAALAANVSFLKLTTAVAFTTDVKGTFSAALGSASVTGMGGNANYVISLYDTTNGKMVVGVVNVGGNADANNVLASSDFVDADIAVIGVIGMTAGDYATFNSANLAAAF